MNSHREPKRPFIKLALLNMTFMVLIHNFGIAESHNFERLLKEFWDEIWPTPEDPQTTFPPWAVSKTAESIAEANTNSFKRVLEHLEDEIWPKAADPQTAAPPWALSKAADPQTAAPPWALSKAAYPQTTAPPWALSKAADPQTAAPPWALSKAADPQTAAPPWALSKAADPQTAAPPWALSKAADPQTAAPPWALSKAAYPQTTAPPWTFSETEDLQEHERLAFTPETPDYLQNATRRKQDNVTIAEDTSQSAGSHTTAPPEAFSETSASQEKGHMTSTTEMPLSSQNATRQYQENVTVAEDAIQSAGPHTTAPPRTFSETAAPHEGGSLASTTETPSSLQNATYHQQENVTVTEDASQSAAPRTTAIPRTFSETAALQENEHLESTSETLLLSSQNVTRQHQENVTIAEDAIQSLNTSEMYRSPSILQAVAERFARNNVLDKGTILAMLMSSMNSLEESNVSSRTCFSDMEFLLKSVSQRQEWALRFVDAAGKPGPSLSKYRLHFVGDYDFCRSLVSEGNDQPFGGNYVVWNMLISPGYTKIPIVSPYVHWGVCMPDTCSEQDNKIIAAEAIRVLEFNGTLRSVNAEIHSDHREASAATYLSIIVICVFGILMFAGTTYDIACLQWPRWKKQWEAEQEKEDENGVVSKGQEKLVVSTAQQANGSKNILISLFGGGKVSKFRPRPPIDDYGSFAEREASEERLSPCKEICNRCKLEQVLLAFSVYTNGKKVLDTRLPPGSISCLHGIRTLSIVWVAMGHLCFMPLGKGLYYNLPADFRSYLKRWSFDVASNAFVCVDTFFMLSGLLVSYVTAKKMERLGWRQNWGLFYFHRIWRLTPPYMLTILLIIGLQQYCGEGPLWEPTQPADKHKCEKYWWANMLYINNFLTSDKLCLAYTWYLSVDMQFFLVSPLMIISFFFHPKLGLGSCAFFLVIQVIATSVIEANKKFSAAPVLNFLGDYHSYLRHLYGAPWCRIGPYVVGIITGYLLATKRDKIKLNWFKATIGWIVATAVALAVTYGLHPRIADVGIHTMPIEAAAFYNIFAGTAWATSLCWMVIACVTGWGGFVNAFLSWSPFVVLSRLVFMVYLLHVPILEMYFENQPRLLYFSNINYGMTLIGLLCVSFAAAFVFALAFELPMVALEKVFLSKRQ